MTNEKRLIDVDYALHQLKIGEIESGGVFETNSACIKDFLNVLPTVDAVEVVHGYWINTPPYRALNGNYNKAQECSVCHAYFVSPGNTPYSNHPYCCECGAKMDGEK